MPTQDARGGAAPGGRPGPGRSDPANDGELLRRVAGGDGAALADLYDRHAGAVFSLGLRIMGDEGEAGRVVEDVFARAWREASGYAPARASVAGWLLETARGAAIERAGGGRRAGAGAADEPAGGAEPAPSETATLRLPSPAGAQGHEDCTPAEADRVRRALAGLPALQRLAIELAYFEGLTPAAIAAQLEQPEGTIHDRLLTGLKSLRGALEDGTA